MDTTQTDYTNASKTDYTRMYKTKNKYKYNFSQLNTILQASAAGEPFSFNGPTCKCNTVCVAMNSYNVIVFQNKNMKI